MSIFHDQALGLVLNFSNPNKGEIDKATKSVAALSMQIDNLVHKELSAGNAITGITKSIGRLTESLQQLRDAKALDRQVHRTAQSIVSRYTPDRLEAIENFAALRREQRGLGAGSLQNALAKLKTNEEAAATYAHDSFGRALIVTSGIVKKNVRGVERVYQGLSATLVEFDRYTGDLTRKIGYVSNKIDSVIKSNRQYSEVSGKLDTGTVDYNRRPVQGYGNAKMIRAGYGGPKDLFSRALELTAQKESRDYLANLVKNADVVLTYGVKGVLEELSKMRISLDEKPVVNAAKLPWSSYGFSPERGLASLARATNPNKLSVNTVSSTVSRKLTKQD